uniref:ETAA1 activator of ATR kinase n=1 Tax=Oreochromis niloticus TaxID=8128 RepID=A0A669DZ71_ORENI
MSGGRPKLGPLAALMGTPLEEQQAAKPRANRLSRSSRQRLGSEQDSPMSQRAGEQFRPAGRVCGESPHNDSDFQQDIIWDATSPSPNRRGKRGKTRPAGAVSISEIVSRIAPKHGRPKDADPTLQQWIGDSASIPCTPDVQPPKPKKKSPRWVQLRRLAGTSLRWHALHRRCRLGVPKEELHLFLFFTESRKSKRDFFPQGSKLPLLPDQRTDNDLDFLFDGPTQYMSGNLSQASSAQSQVEPPREASWKPSASSHGPTSAVSAPHGNGTSAGNDFEDDWGDDNLLNDSLVLEMTQNPLKFASPKFCSTQTPAGQASYQREAPAAAGVAVGLGQSPNPAFSVERIQNAHRQVGYSSYPAGRDSDQSESSSWRARETCKSNPVKPDLQKPPSDLKRTSAGICRSAVSQTTNAPNFPQKAGVSSHSEPPADADFLNDDLDAFFLSEPVWDDPADDELLCEMCEDLERQILGVAEKQAPLIGQIPSQSAALPTDPVSMFVRVKRFCGFGAVCVTLTDFSLSAVRGKCSAAEIERKKQQAMERRRQRLQAAQNLRDVT